MLAIEAPEHAAARGGLLEVLQALDGSETQAFYQGVTFQGSLCGHARPVPTEGAAITAPVLVLGATTATGGAFAAGTYFWKITALGTYGGETGGSNEVTATLALNDSKGLSWAAVTGATGYKLYRGTASNSQNVLVATLGVVTSYTDTGANEGAAGVPGQSTAGNVAAAPKTFDQLPIVSGTPFSIYRGVDMSLFQHSITGDEAMKAFNAGESWAVERAIHGLHLAGAVDITPFPGTPLTKPRQALGLLQQYAADNYSGLPMLHANKYGTELMVEDLAIAGDYALHTKQGVPFVNGGGYPTASGPGTTPDGSTWVYATGQTTLWRGIPTFVENAYHLKDNRNYSLVEVTWVATVECFKVAVLVAP